MNHIAKVALLVGAVLAWLVRRHLPTHRPVAIALTLILAGDTLRWLCPLPARPGLALYVAVFGCSAWAGRRAFRLETWGPVWLWLPIELWILAAPAPRSWWAIMPKVALGAAVVIQLAAAVRFYLERGPSSITQRVALALCVGDLAGLIGGRSELLLELQGAVVALFIAGVQGLWLAGLPQAGRRRPRRARPPPCAPRPP